MVKVSVYADLINSHLVSLITLSNHTDLGQSNLIGSLRMKLGRNRLYRFTYQN